MTVYELYEDDEPFADPGYTVVGGSGWTPDESDDDQMRPTPTPAGTTLGTVAGSSTTYW